MHLQQTDSYMGSVLSNEKKSSPAEDASPPCSQDVRTRGLRVVMISDTHNWHRSLKVPEGDLLIHAGDYTRYGKLEDAVDFNDWLGELPHKTKIVVNGNHEANAPWKANVKQIVSNALVLIDESVSIECRNGELVHIHGCNFSWPIKHGRSPFMDKVSLETNILITHGPAQGYLDNDVGCPAVLSRCEELASAGSLELVVCGVWSYTRSLRSNQWRYSSDV